MNTSGAKRFAYGISLSPIRMELMIWSLAWAVASGVLADDHATLRRNLVERFSASAPSERAVRTLIDRLQPDGSWPDVDYKDQQRGAWRTYAHVSRLLELAEAYRREGHPFCGSPEVRDAVTRGLEFWLDGDYRNPNWWYGRIGVPKAVAPLLILMSDDLPRPVRDRAIEQVLGRSRMGMTGQNEVWVAGIALMKGLLTGDDALMDKAHRSIVSQIRITTAEGVQPDFSFHQHGPQQQWGNYGSSFAHDAIQWARVFHGTRFQLDDSQMLVLRQYVLEGLSWVVWKGRMDISGCGRQIFPGCQVSKGQSVLRMVDAMSELDKGAAESYELVLSSQDERKENQLVGHRHYWRSDMAIHRRPTWYSSVKMSSKRVIGAETCNSENLLGLHLADGVTYFLCSGREYEDLFPVWDWRKLPGTTCRQDEGSLVPNNRACRGQSDFVGGATCGDQGVATMDYRRGSLSANKAWFFLKDAVVCLGNGIECDDVSEVVTTLDQCRFQGAVTVGQPTARRIEPGQHDWDDVSWLHHGKMGYLLIEPRRVHVEGVKRTGNWRKVHDRKGYAEDSAEVFHAWISHGIQPRNGRYAYAVFPDTTADVFQRRLKSLSFDVLQNDEHVQAISAVKGNMVFAVFRHPERIALANDRWLEVDRPCVLIVDTTDDQLYVADPTHQQEQIKIRWKRDGDHSDRVTHLDVQLPSGGDAGKTVALRLERQRPK